MMNYYESAKGVDLENCVFSFGFITNPNRYLLLDIGTIGMIGTINISYNELDSFFNGKNEVAIKFLKKKGYTNKISDFKTKKGFIDKVKNNRK